MLESFAVDAFIGVCASELGLTQIVTIIPTGINGAGKSTTLQILTRDLQATSGNISVDGKPITSR